MKKLKFSIIILSTLIVLYLGFLSAVSSFLNSDKFVQISNNFIKTKYNLDFDISGFKVELSPLLSGKIMAKSIIIKDGDKIGINIQNLNAVINVGELKKTDADLIYANLDILNKIKIKKPHYL